MPGAGDGGKTGASLRQLQRERGRCADVDWSHMKTVWANQHPMDSSGLMVKQAEALRALNPHTRFFVYRNLVKALPWITCVREKLEDPAFSGWFLKYDPTKKSYAPKDHHYLVTKTHLVRTPSRGRLRARLWLTDARSRWLCVRRIAMRRGAS